MNYIDN